MAIDATMIPGSSISVNMLRRADRSRRSPPPARRSSQGPLDDDEASGWRRRFKAIADPARLRLLSLIQAQPDGEACVCHLTEPLGLSQPTVSHHLKVLLQAGLVEREQRGSWAYYRVVPEPLAALRDVLADLIVVNVLFVCIGNSGRSVMAERLFRRAAGDATRPAPPAPIRTARRRSRS